MTTTNDLANHWPLRGDPTRLYAAASVLRASSADEADKTHFPREFIVAGVARLIEVLAYRIHEHVDVGHEVVSAATDIAEHVLASATTDRTCATERRARRPHEPFGLPFEPGDARAWPLT